MIQIDDKIISLELFTARFCCDLGACRGECCVEGNAGAPLDAEEVAELENEWEHYAPYMTQEGIGVVQRLGVAVTDEEGDLTTPLVAAGAECVYAIRENGVTWCAIEKAWREGRTPFRKPISCHLYPIRLVRLSNGMTGLQYHRWEVCRAAEVLGAERGEPLYRTLREPIVRRFGEAFFRELAACESE
ncbi:DUF3109 family protein, partial [uncultured Rikenella sp.]|uniref:DUF3109 family protein n=1 Tax=uncultured Rikenella sp. TaxID=368003 RepID=UPI00261271C9